MCEASTKRPQRKPCLCSASSSMGRERGRGGQSADGQQHFHTAPQA